MSHLFCPQLYVYNTIIQQCLEVVESFELLLLRMWTAVRKDVHSQFDKLPAKTNSGVRTLSQVGGPPVQPMHGGKTQGACHRW
jgi:hypothetical protein